MPATRKDAGGVACHEHGPWRGSRVRGGRADLLEAGPVPGDGLSGVLGQVMPQVPAQRQPHPGPLRQLQRDLGQ